MRGGHNLNIWSSPVRVEEWKSIPLPIQTTRTMSIRNNYSKEYKEEAIRLAQQQGNQSKTARDLGLPSSVLSRWMKELKEDPQKAFPGKGHSKGTTAREVDSRGKELSPKVAFGFAASLNRKKRPLAYAWIQACALAISLWLATNVLSERGARYPSCSWPQ